MTFQYEIPASETVVRRMFRQPSMVNDMYEIQINGVAVATVDYDQASAYWTGKKSLVDIVGHEALRRHFED